jgi:ATP-dependent RNA helicase DHX8/PRP22
MCPAAAAAAAAGVTQVCPTRGEWVEPLLPKLQDVDIQRLSGGRLAEAAAAADPGAGGAPEVQPGCSTGGAGQGLVRRNDDGAVDAARQRYLQRKQAAAAAGKRK